MRYLQFKDLHQSGTPFLLGNVWNVQSALVFERLGFKAIGTSSAAIAHSLGYQDGEDMPFEDMIFIVSHICKSTSIPLTVDIESGYGTTARAVFENIKQLYNLGVVGINIEDSYVKNEERMQKDKNEFYDFLKDIVWLLKQENIKMFINVRCDSFLLKPGEIGVKDAIERVLLYQTIDIDGIFLPGIVEVEDIKQVKKVLELPLNVMCLPNLPNFKALGEVERISIGNFQNDYIYNILLELNQEIIRKQSFKILFDK
ncbi:isocitrate lyase/PEP mutase family protein [Myroides marinus]|uniref:isocitrate lyase/PEP mutase family protein n=1 Tax=Myroides marinus TaxID=703342 RepID=UPI002575521E|nr:isocitrate lyase/phosphoenolpyruvate mutase family protein [Myroides marinus]MDM1346852.1 isocitrate lyase/phosphoenolpyruvate mutase family protein [Myroides marinus]MDM1370794.1 isocitrate lyase/phosphoenolpyruvate mutase family protein [Myroides marinus]MDM1531863.1 isocitrate lyase/phosphoenolpyruvate mutase family protein [Myroides marinus]MDM1538713.1 isocitrate lyase/phosphoenolpyruvate mutase family protein [Myroides marinus]